MHGFDFIEIYSAVSMQHSGLVCPFTRKSSLSSVSGIAETGETGVVFDPCSRLARERSEKLGATVSFTVIIELCSTAV